MRIERGGARGNTRRLWRRLATAVVISLAACDGSGKAPSGTSMPSQDAPAESAVPEAPSSTREPVVPLVTTPVPDDDSLRLSLIVEMPAGEPAAGATVTVVDLATVLEQEAELFLQGLDGEGLRRRGRRFTTDEAGRVAFEASLTGGFVLVEQGDLSGFTDYDHHLEEHPNHTVRLAPETPIRVLVRDASGAPAAGVPVSLRFRGDEVQDLVRATTDARGEARLTHLRTVLGERDEPERPVTIEEPGLYVAAAILAAEPVEVPLSVGNLPEEPIELRLPPTGTLEVRLEDAHGVLLPRPCLVELELVPDRELSADEQWTRQYLSPALDDRVRKLSANGGRAVLTHVGLGLRFGVSAQPFGEHRPAETTGPGPRASGEVSVLRVPVVEQLPSLVARLVRADGSPWRTTAVEAHLWIESEGGSRGAQRTLATDAEGRILIALDARWPRAGRLDLTLWIDDGDGQRHWWGRDQETTLAPGANELGELALTPLPLLAAGRVVDGRGLPLAASVALTPTNCREGWRCSTRTASDGSFALLGEAATEELVLEVGAEGHVTGFRTVRRGDAEVVLTLDAGGTLAGELMAEESFPFELLRARASNGVEELALELMGPRFAFEKLPPGEYELVLELADEPESALRFPGVLVRAGEVTRDPRLRPLDLRGVFQSFTLTFPGAGDDWLDLHVHRRAAGAATYGTGTWTHARELVLATAHPALDLRIAPAGHRTFELTGLDAARDVELTPGLAIRVRLTPPLELAEGEYLELELDPPPGTALERFFGPRFHDGEHCEFVLSEGGPYGARLNLLLQIPGDLATVPLPLEPPVVFDVREDETPQSFELHLPAACLRSLEAARAER